MSDAQRTVEELTSKGEKISFSASIADEIDAMKSRLLAVKTASGQWLQKMENLVSSWKGFESDFEQMRNWLLEKESALESCESADLEKLPDLTDTLDALKELCNDVNQNQNNFLRLSKECDVVSSNLNQDVAAEMRSSVNDTKHRLTSLAEKCRDRISVVTEAHDEQREAATKIEDFKRWVRDFDNQCKDVSEVPCDKINEALEKVHSLSQEHADKDQHISPLVKGHGERNILKEAIGDFDCLGRLLEEKKTVLQHWAIFWDWHEECNSALCHMHQTLDSGQPTSSQLEATSAELENLALQCKTRQAEVAEDEKMATKSTTYVMREKKPMSILLLVADVLQKIVSLKDIVQDKEESIQNMEDQWEAFKQAEQKLADWLQVVLQNVQQISVRESNLKSLQDASAAVSDLSKQCDEKTSLKDQYESIGKGLLKTDPQQSHVIQDALKEANSKWGKVSNLLKDQQEKSKALINLWDQSKAQKESVLGQLAQCNDTLDLVSGTVPQSPKETAELVDKCKLGIDALKKVRQPFEAFYKKQTQLIQELQTVPGFDVSPLRTELQSVQQQYGHLGVTLKGKVNTLESELVLWQQLQQNKEEINVWLEDTKSGMTDAMQNLANQELARIRLEKYRNELPAYLNMKDSLQAKSEQLKSNHTIPSLETMIQDINENLDLTKNLSESLETGIQDISNASEDLKKRIKDAFQWLSNKRDAVLKCDDTSGNDSQINQRLEAVKLIETEAEGFDDSISVIEQGSQAINKKYGQKDSTNYHKDIANLEKKYDLLMSQIGKIKSNLYNILEKRYVNEVQGAMKLLSSSMNQLQLCQPETCSDKFGLESKLEILKDALAKTEFLDSEDSSLKLAANNLVQVVELDKANEIKDTISGLGKQREELKKESKSMQTKINELLSLWNTYDNAVEDATKWLKEVDDKFCSVVAIPVELDNFKDVSNKLSNILCSLEGNKAELENVQRLTDDIARALPDCKIGNQYLQLDKKYGAILKAIAAQEDKLKGLFVSKDAQRDAIDAFENWLSDSNTNLKPFETLGKQPNKPIPEERISELKQVLAEKTLGNKLLEKAIDAGENLFAYIAPKDRDRIRSHIREMRDSWENHIDYMNDVQKSVDTIAMKWASFDDNHAQIKKWIEATKSNLETTLPKGTTVQEKKAILQGYKNIHQDILSHSTIMEGVKEKAEGLDNEEAVLAVESSHKMCEELKGIVVDKLTAAEKIVENHVAYVVSLDKLKDLLATARKEMDLLLVSTNDKQSATKGIQILDSVLNADKEFESLQDTCLEKQVAVLQESEAEVRDSLTREHTKYCEAWKHVMEKAVDHKAHLQKIAGQWDDLKQGIDELSQWLSEKEGCIKDHTMKDSQTSKQQYAEFLRGLLHGLTSEGYQFDRLSSQSQLVEGDSDINEKMAALNSRYIKLKKSVSDVCSKYDQFVKEHKSFNEQLHAFSSWLKMMNDDLTQHSEVVGDLKVLQERKTAVEELEELRCSEASKFELIMELGEKLYSHTSPDGKEVLRKQVMKMRNDWDRLTEDIRNALNKLDTCLQQFADFTELQEQLTKWLKDIESAMQQHTELRPSLEEKRGQLQSHTIVHQEITSHNSLVDAVCNKAQELVDQTQDRSLNVYISSIRALFANIGIKSKDLMDKLTSCVADHRLYIDLVKSFGDFCSVQNDLLSHCADVEGEKCDLERKLQVLGELKENRTVGEKKCQELEQLCMAVCKSTAGTGCDRLKQELLEIKENWKTQEALVDNIDMNIQKAQGQWKQFEDDLSKHAGWFKLYEDILKNQCLQGSQDSKKQTLDMLNDKRQDIVDYEKTIDDFVNHAHNLLQNTGAERLKPAITQVSNRYQLLHVLSKEIVARWQGMVEEHENYDLKLSETGQWLHGLEDNIERAMKEINSDIKSEMLQSIIAEQERAPVKLNKMSSLGERLFVDTDTHGREAIRNELKDLRKRWDNILERAERLQKKQDAQSKAWTLYKDSLVQANQWLESMEASLKNDQINWLSLQETRSRLLKMKTDLQDIFSHKRFIESVNEKGAAVVQANPHAAADEIQIDMENINGRYAELAENVKSVIETMEESIDYIQAYQDQQKSHCDWQKIMWDKLSTFSDCTGTKQTVQARLEKVETLGEGLGEGKRAISELSKQVDNLARAAMPERAMEAMGRDIDTIQYDHEKFCVAIADAKQGLQARMDQWVEYEGQYEKIISWLSESEGMLKGYTSKGSCEEKVQQLQRFQDFNRVVDSWSSSVQEYISLADQLEQSVLFNLRIEGESEKMCDENGSDISSHLSSESRISMNVQQVTSRYHGIQNTIKDVLKKCNMAVSAHRDYDNKYQELCQEVFHIEGQCKRLASTSHGDKGEIVQCQKAVEELLEKKHALLTMLNSVTEVGEKLLNYTATEGKESIQASAQHSRLSSQFAATVEH